jgi:uncharacterized protein
MCSYRCRFFNRLDCFNLFHLLVLTKGSLHSVVSYSDNIFGGEMNQKFISRSILLIIFISIFLFSCTKEVDFDSLVERNGIKYKVNSKVGYSGKAVSIHENGQLGLKCSYVNGYLEGLYTEWFDNGQLKTEFIYKKGKKIGESTEWYRNGQLKSEYAFFNGDTSARYEEFWGSGKRKALQHYALGKRTGESFWLNEHGDTTHIENYANDSLHGESMMFWNGNTLKAKGFYSHGKAVGEHLTYYENGDLKYRTQFDSLGNRKKQDYYKVNKETNVVTLYTYTFKNNKNQYLRSSNENGQVVFLQDFIKDEIWRYHYWDNGNLRYKYQMGETGYNGLYYEYKISGVLWISGQYENGKKTGLWEWFDKFGNVINREYHSSSD